MDNRVNKTRKGSEKGLKMKVFCSNFMEAFGILFVIVLAGIFCLPSINTLFAAHPPETVITEYTYESELDPNEFIKWDFLGNEIRGNYTWRIVQKDDQIILLRFHLGTLSGYAYYLNNKLYIYANGDSGRTHFMKEMATPAKKRSIDTWLDRYRKVKVSFINSSPFTVLGLVKFVIKDGKPVDYMILNEKWNEISKIIFLEFGTYGLTKYDPESGKIIDYRTFEVDTQWLMIRI